ncbi:MAG: glycerol-3-phosphate dehydrogenase [Erythrobacter sp.]|nr:glycerol-3-phosphate dehydrogenase [Erythrobacter sp.]NCQ64454.1 glycerol-3-phosphate dehydrogenase [Alphaproteobacteria bacterium]
MYDVAVIGGGINGCGIARDAAGRGARVLLLEAGDLASGTSSASSKLIHGGLRYLEHYEFALVRESLFERERLWAIAPHVIWPMRFVLPYVHGLRPRWLLRLGLFLYDHIGGRRKLPATETIGLAAHPAGAPLKPEFQHGFVYSDCWADDARLVVLNARDAANRGADVRTRTRVTAFGRDGDQWRIAAGDETFHARALVNAAGPGVLRVLETGHVAEDKRMRLVRGSHIVVRRLFDHPFAYFFQLPDGRIFFAIPYEEDFTLIGTTDADHAGSLEHVEASAEEIAYLCEGASRFFAQAVTPADVVWSYAGVRPLIDDGSGKPEAATRGYRLELSPEEEGAPLLNVFGGKLTVYRHLAEEAMGKLATRMALLDKPAWTGGETLPGGDFARDGADDLIARIAARYPFFDARTQRRLTHGYGTTTFEILGDSDSLAACGEDFGHGLTAREVDYLVAREWAQTADDILWRRTKLGLRLEPDRVSALESYLQEKSAF